MSPSAQSLPEPSLRIARLICQLLACPPQPGTDAGEFCGDVGGAAAVPHHEAVLVRRRRLPEHRRRQRALPRQGWCRPRAPRPYIACQCLALGWRQWILRRSRLAHPNIQSTTARLLPHSASQCKCRTNDPQSVVAALHWPEQPACARQGSTGSPGHYLLGLRVLNMLVLEMNQPTPGRTLTQHRKVAVSFRDQVCICMSCHVEMAVCYMCLSDK